MECASPLIAINGLCSKYAFFSFSLFYVAKLIVIIKYLSFYIVLMFILSLTPNDLSLTRRDLSLTPRDLSLKPRVLSGECSAGTYIGISECIDCPIGTYTDTVSQTSCNTCGGGTSTVGIGSTASSNCIG